MSKIAKYKSKPQLDIGIYYAPYVPLRLSRDLIDSTGELWVKLNFLPNEMFEWIRQNDIHCKIVFDVIQFYNSADFTAFHLRWSGT